MFAIAIYYSLKSAVKMNLPAEKETPKKVVSPPSSPFMVEKKKTPEKGAAVKTDRKASAAAADHSQEEQEEVDNGGMLSDENEIVSLWNQTWGALSMCLTIIAPLFLVVIFYCYLLGTFKQSQAIASVGVVYTLLFFTIMGSYALVIVPCILIARLFTCIVSPHASCHTTEEVNLCARMGVLIMAAAGVTYYFLNQ